VSKAEQTRRWLNVVAVVAVVDAFLLVPLVIAALEHAEGTVDVLGPLHGGGFLLLLGLIVRGTLKGLWGWWFPAIALVTAGPPGCLIADIRIRRSLARTRA
jgi:hypothetical protein